VGVVPVALMVVVVVEPAVVAAVNVVAVLMRFSQTGVRLARRPRIKG